MLIEAEEGRGREEKEEEEEEEEDEEEEEEEEVRNKRGENFGFIQVRFHAFNVAVVSSCVRLEP